MVNEKNFLEEFLDYVKTIMDAKGINPQPGFFLVPGGKLHVAAFLDGPEEIVKSALIMAVKIKAVCFAFGLDRNSLPGQGIDDHYKSVFTIAYFPKDSAMQVICLPYNNPGDIGEVQYDNKLWYKRVTHELLHCGYGVLKQSLQTNGNDTTKTPTA